jgi:hypothetical protein
MLRLARSPSRGVLLEHLGAIDDPREPWRVAHPLPEVLLLVVCGTIADCDDYESIADWGEAHLAFLRRFLPYHHGFPGARWLTQLMNRIAPNLFSAAFAAWARETWPARADLVAIDGKTSRRSHDLKVERGPLHLVSVFATTSRLVLGQEPVADKSGETTAIRALLERLAADGGLKDALVSIDAIATNATIAGAIRQAGADYLLAVKAKQPGLRAGQGSESGLTARMIEDGGEVIRVPSCNLAPSLDASLVGYGAHEVDGEVPHDGHVVCAMTFAHAGLIIGEGHVEDPVEGVFDGPMSAYRGGCALGGERGRGDVIPGLEATAVGQFGPRAHAHDRGGGKPLTYKRT